MKVARVDRESGTIVNIEIADQAWVDANADDPTFLFVPYTDEPVIIGGAYDMSVEEFVAPADVVPSQPPVVPVDDADFLNVEDGIEVQP